MYKVDGFTVLPGRRHCDKAIIELFAMT